MGTAVRCEAELRQDQCSHRLVIMSDADKARLAERGQRDYKYQCVKCGRCLKNLNGVLLQTGNARRIPFVISP